MGQRSEILAELPKAFADERLAVEFVEKQRWGSTPNCPRCGDTDVAQMKARDGSRNARWLWRCHGCREQYTVRTNTVMQESKIPLRFWCLAFYRACASKKGVSALQIQRETGLSYRSALFMMHRVRAALAPANAKEPKLNGIVEYDECYVGGKPRGLPNYMLTTGKRKIGPAADFKERKTPVVGGIERGGRIKMRVVNSVTTEALSQAVRDMVDPSAVLMTDERRGYQLVGREFAAHHTIKHYRGHWADGEITTNRIESCWALVKRQMIGTHHSVSRKHLPKYISEIEFRLNTRHLDDGERTALAIQSADHKRLTYKEQIGD